MKAFFIVVFFVILYINQCDSKEYHNHTLYRAIPVTKAHLGFLSNLSTIYKANVWRLPSYTYRPSEFVIPPEKKQEFLRQAALHGIYLTTIIENVQNAFDKQTVKTYIRRNMESFDWRSYFRLDDIYEWMRDLNSVYSSVMQLHSIGITYEKREILAAKINFGKSRNKPKVFVEGGIHAREWISISFVTYFMHQILTASSENIELKNIAEAYEWFFVPVLNPDGYEYTHVKDRLYRKNLRGVDINRNFGIQFGTVGVSSSKTSDVYCGPRAFSEAESAAMGNFIRENKDNLKYYLAFHSYGQYLIIPYAYSAKHQENFNKVYVLGKFTAKHISRRYGTQYSIGTAYDTVGYLTSGVSGCWVKKLFNVPYVLTFELRDDGHHGFALPPNLILPTCLETMDGVLALLDPSVKLEGDMKISKGSPGAHIIDSFIILWNVFLVIIVCSD